MNVLLFPIRLTTPPRAVLLIATAVGLIVAWTRVTSAAGRMSAPSTEHRVLPPAGLNQANPVQAAAANRPLAVTIGQQAENPEFPVETAEAAPAPVASDLLRAWALRDPAAAVRWLAGAPPGEDRDAVMEVVGAELASYDPAEAVALADRYASGNIPLLANLVQAWAERDHEGALGYARGKPPGELQSRLLTRIAMAQAPTDPAAAASLVLTDIAQPDLRDEAVIAIVHRWAQHDASAAAAWIERWPASELRERALLELR